MRGLLSFTIAITTPSDTTPLALLRQCRLSHRISTHNYYTEAEEDETRSTRPTQREFMTTDRSIEMLGDMGT